MKKTNKILAMLMVLLMLVQVVMPVSVFADTVYTPIELGDTPEFDFSPEAEENIGYYSFTPSEAGRYNVNVNANADIDLYIYEAETGEMLGNVYVENVAILGADLEADVEYYIDVYVYSDFDGTCDVDVVHAPAVTDVTINSIPYQTVILKDEIDAEDPYVDYWGLSINVFFDDDTSAYYEYDGNLGFIGGYPVNVTTEFDDPTNLGKTTVEVGGKTDTFKIDIIDNPIKKIEYVGEPISYTEKTHGYVDVDYEENEFYYYNVNEIYESDAFKVTYKDGKTELVNIFETLFGNYDISYITNQYEQPWTIGGNNIITAFIGEVSCEIKVELKKTNVSKIEVKANPTTQYVYGSSLSGYMNDAGEYEIYLDEVDGLEFEVTFKDGSKKTFHGEDVDVYGENIGSYFFSTSTYFTVEKAGTIEVPFNFEGVESKFKITVKPSNVKKLELTKDPTHITVPEGFVTGYIGAEFKATYTDGKTETIKVTKENVRVMGEECYVFLGEDAETLSIGYSGDGMTAYFGAASCTLPEITYTEPLDVVDIDVKNFGKDNMEIILIFADDSKETVKIDRVDVLGGFDVEYDYYYTVTKYGLLEVTTMVRKDAGLSKENTVIALGCSFTEEINKNVKLSKIEVSTKPRVVRYEKGEKFDPSGLVIKTTYDNGETGYLYYDSEYYDIEISAVDTSKEGTKTVKVKFGGKEASFTIEVGGSFKDVKKGAWYEQYVDYATKYGIFNGTGGGNFSPDAKLSRAQFVQVLANIEGVDIDNTIESDFKDVPSNKWFTGAVAWAAENNIVSGSGDGKFNPNADVSREQMCVILVNFMEKYWYGEFDKVVIATTFADDAQISSWAKDSVYKAFRAGLVTGTGNNKFSPKLSATRSQGATIFTKFHNEYIV